MAADVSALFVALAGLSGGWVLVEELPIACGARVTFFAGPKKVVKEMAWLSPG